MTLHEAIEKLLRQICKSMTTHEIANELNKNKWYEKKDGSAITAFQIHGRTKNYPNIFNRNGSIVSLNEKNKIKVLNLKQKVEKSIDKIASHSRIDLSVLEKELMDEKNFKRASTIDNFVPHNSGLYCMRINNFNLLPKPFDTILKDRQHNIIYIGIASKSLKKRFLNQELRANGHGTFFRSIGAILGYRPLKGSLVNKVNKKNYTFTTTDELKIIEWININLLVNWVEYNGDFEHIETQIIRNHSPLLNLAKNPAALKLLSELRLECVRIANEF